MTEPTQNSKELRDYFLGVIVFGWITIGVIELFATFGGQWFQTNNSASIVEILNESLFPGTVGMIFMTLFSIIGLYYLKKGTQSK